MTESPTLDRILVLNVKAFTGRRQFMERQLAEFGLSAEFVTDWDAEELTAEILSLTFGNDDLTPGQQSCALKHVEALRRIAAAGNRQALVLEDDAVFSPDFLLGITRALQQSERFPGHKVIYIGSGGNFFTPKSQRRPGQYLYPGHRGRFADSYIIDSATAQKRLNWIAENRIAQPIDNQFETIDKALDIQMLWLEEPVVEQGSKNGLFRSALESDPPPWLKGWLFRWEKLKRKYIYQLWR
ncbi:glycosyl transferase [Methylomonas sp. LWB]|uniref:glycosyltransferase family 25 protein n=1 Tax=Methylomonas sp. LWB TaxID=1905845 RepID=UPI0008D9DC6A|nr:glycosyltransferase family 25 protein [Methylomonas sp. LWB]OHX38297.1 glycosyl transferase [Methylomonas sp. LWB]